jgi:predicted restriction endonuclease
MHANSGDYFEIEAAHIYPVSGVELNDATEGGPDTIKNGFALCRTHHWAFDNGWFTISDDYTVHIRGDPSQSGYKILEQYDGVRLKLPEDESLWPAQYYLQAHRERV